MTPGPRQIWTAPLVAKTTVTTNNDDFLLLPPGGVLAAAVGGKDRRHQISLNGQSIRQHPYPRS
jgi:hypothetical protein